MDPQSDIAQPNGKQTPSTGVPQVPQTSPLPQEGQVYTQSPMGAASEVTPIQQQANMPVYPQSATHQYPPMNPGVPAQVFANVPPMQGSGYPNQMPPYQPMSMPGQGIPQAQPMTQGMPPYGGVQQGVPINGQPFPVQGQMMPPQVQVPPRSSKKVLVTILVLLLTSGAAYGMYVYKDTIKARLPYFGSAVVFTEDNFTTSMIDKFKTVNSAEYTVSGNIYVRDRESGVVSMDSKAAPTQDFTVRQ
jgi:hypothetical protein